MSEAERTITSSPPDGDGSPRLSILIVSWNTRDRLGRCLASIESAATEVICVDNASTDGTVPFVAERFPRVRLVPLPRNVGFAAGVNEAARHATGQWLLILNPDIEARTGAIDALLAAAAADERIGAAGGRLIGEDDRPQDGFNVRRFPTVGALLVDLLLLDVAWPENPATRRYLARDVDIDGVAVADVDQPAAACLLVRRAAFDEVGGFDAAFFPAWFEDVDFCRRLRARDWRIVIVSEARFTHCGGVARDRLGIGGFSLAYHRNMERYVRKHHGRAALVSIKAATVVGMSMRATWSLLTGRTEAARGYACVIAQSLTPHADCRRRLCRRDAGRMVVCRE